MKQNIRVILLGLVVLTWPIMAYDAKNTTKNGVLAKLTWCTGTVSATLAGWKLATKACNYITPDAIKNSLTFSSDIGGLITGIRAALNNHKEVLSHPYMWGTVGAATAACVTGRYIYFYTPAGCINEFKKLFGLQDNPNWKSVQPRTGVDIVSLISANGWPFLGMRTYPYYNVTDYLSSLSFRCSVAKMFFGNADNNDDLQYIMWVLENMKGVIITSELYKDEIMKMKVSAQEKSAEAAQVRAHAAHKSTFDYFKSLMLNKALNYSGVGFLGLVGLCVGYQALVK